MLDVRRMKVLREVAARGSFSAAAEALSFTQSAISQQVAALERETGTKLVERGPRGIRLTQAGEVVVKHADAVLARLSCAEEELQALAGLKGGKLAMSTFQSAGATLLPRAISAFAARYPDVELGLITAEPDEASQLLRAGELDLAVVYGFDSNGDGLDETLDAVPLIEDRYELLLACDHPLAEKSRIRMADLADERWVNSTGASGCRQIVLRACANAGFEPRVAFETDEILAIQALVANGMGVALLPQLALNAVHPGVAVRPLAGEAPMRWVFATRLGDAFRSPATGAMLQLLVDMAEEFRPQIEPTDGAIVAA
jgi:DNA-binding transcriptional LysR family regulator